MKISARSNSRKFGSIRLFGTLAIVMVVPMLMHAALGWTTTAERNDSSVGLTKSPASRFVEAASVAAPETVVLSDNFEAATTFVAANSTANAWVIGTAAANGGTQGAYISSDAGANNTYNNGIPTVANHIYAPITVPAGETAVVLSFDWRTIGDYDRSAADLDYVRVSVRSTIPVAGTKTALTEQIPVTFSGQDNYTKAYVNLPASVATGTTQYLVFTWVNDNIIGTLPGAIDNVLVTSLAPAPLSGSKTIPGDYPTIGAAIADVNAHGADTSGGSLTFNVAAGSTFTETPFPLTTSGSSATNRIIFQRSGAGANPKVLAEGGGNFGAPSLSSVTSTSDAIIALNGVDFITFDGIDVQSNSPSGSDPFTKVEYGYLLRNNNILANVTTINGSQNNIIQNTSITLDRRKVTPTINIGIMQSAASATGAGSAATSAAQSNSGNKYYNLTISNAGAGIYLLGTAAFPDDLVEVGTTSPTTFNRIGSATANDINSKAATTWGIRFESQSNAKVFNNEIRNITGTSTNTVAGIHMDNAGPVTAVSLGTTQIYNNIIHDLKNTSTTAGVTFGIRASLTGNAGSISRIQNNFVYGLNSASTVTTSVRLFGIQVQDAGDGTGATHNVHNNSVRIAMPSLGTISTCFGNGGAAATNPVYNVRNNIFANVTGAQAGLAKHYAWVSTSNTSIGLAVGTVSDFNDLFVANANGFVGRGNTIDYATLAAWQTAIGDDANSESVDPFFVSTTDLHLQGTSPVLGDGILLGGIVDNDFDNDLRDDLPDIGADEIVIGRTGTIPAGTYRDANIGNGTLGGNVTITGALTMSGMLSTGGNTLIVDCGATATGGSPSSFVDGNLRKNYCTAETFAYPVGTTTTGNEYSPVTATVTALGTSPSSLTVDANKGGAPASPPLADGTTLDRFWTLTESGDLTADLVFSYLDGDVDGAEANYHIIKTNGTVAVRFPDSCPTTSCVDDVANTMTISGLSSFSHWTAGEPDAPTAATANIGGHVLNNFGAPMAGVTMTLLDTILVENRTTTTDANGFYQFNAILTGRTILVTPSRNGLSFSPQNRLFNHIGELANVDFTGTPDAGQTGRRSSDFDGDGKTDLAVFRPSDASWYILLSSTGVMKSQQWGLGDDRIVPADYDGDGSTDIAVFRPSNGGWYINQSSNSTLRSVNWGLAEDVVTPADFDGDGQADVAVWRPSTGTWYIILSSNGQTRTVNWGTTGDRPVAADYDGDGKSDIAIWRPSNGTWYIMKSSDGTYQYQHWGIEEDRAVVGDYDGDNKSDLAVFRPSTATWYVKLSSDASTSWRGHGTAADVLTPGDYDGDGKTDRAVWQTGGDWNILRSSSNSTWVQTWGTSGDIPTTSAYVR